MIELPLQEVEWRSTRVVLEYASVAAGALDGCLHATRRGHDIVGVVVIGIAAGLGGGLLRDAILASGPALALRIPGLLAGALAASAVGVLLGSRASRVKSALDLADALALGLFTLAGIQRAEDAGLGILSCLFLGVVTSTGGGVVRDVLCRETPVLLLPGGPYATASLFGGLVYFAAERLIVLQHVSSELLALAATFGLRVLGVARQWITPVPDELFKRR